MENQTLGQRAVEGIIDLIKEREYAAGDRLPTEKELSEILGVSRNMVREALRVLVSRNLVTIKQGAGTFLSDKAGVVDDPFGFSFVEDKEKLTEDLLQIRAILEPSIAALAAENAGEQEIAELEEVLLELEGKMERREDYWELDTAFHTKIAGCTHNTVMANLIPVIAGGVRVFAHSVETVEFEQTLISHRAIFKAIRDRKPTEASQAMLYHILYNNNRYMEEKKKSNSLDDLES